MATSSGSSACPARINELCVAQVGANGAEAIDREIAIRILDALTRYGDSGQGDIRALGGGMARILSVEGGRLPIYVGAMPNPYNRDFAVFHLSRFVPMLYWISHPSGPIAQLVRAPA